LKKTLLAGNYWFIEHNYLHDYDSKHK
jgi:hypothetical protein